MLAYLLDGIHEDLNRVVDKKPTTPIELNSEQLDMESLTNAAKQSWQNHLLRNDSIVVDLYQAQLKSTVKCPDCNRVRRTLMPFVF